MRRLFDITFTSTEEIRRLAEEQAQLLHQNAETAVANTVLLGVARIANDCPVDTGRARASIAGELADDAGVILQGDPQAIAEGKSQSVTGFDGLEGRVGSNVEYMLHLEYRGERPRQRVKLTRKQIKYLFAKKILENDGQGGIKYNYVPKRIKKAFFRKNTSILQRNLNMQMEKAVEATSEGRLLREGE